MVSSLGSTTSISQLFAKLDTRSQGYLEKSDLLSAFAKISGDSSSSGAGSAADTTSGTASGTATAANSDSQTLFKIMQLMHAYGSLNDNNSNAALSSLLPVSA